MVLIQIMLLVMIMEKIKLAHGAGGSLMQEFIDKYIVKNFGGSSYEVPLEALDDSAIINDIAFTSDSHAVKPIFFPGGDIGRLSIAGTVNDLLAIGAQPIALSCALLIEEGFNIIDLEKILLSMKETCFEANVHIVTGDTKVLEEDGLDGIIIGTSGIGYRHPHLDHNFNIIGKARGSQIKTRWLVDSNLRNGDKIIISGTLGDHGIALMAFREGYGFEINLKSDVKPLNGLVNEIMPLGGIVAMKDPTRGGLAALLNEWSRKSGVGLRIEEESIPLREGVLNSCEMLGINPLEIANEGKFVLAVVPDKAEEILDTLRSQKDGKDAAIIGEVNSDYDYVVLITEVGGKRILPPPIGDPIPRIC
jgi:hydrogenase expression/formation protein HypE